MLMIPNRAFVFAAAVLLAAGTSGSNAADKKAGTVAESPGWNDAQMQQPATESIDLNTYNLIRDEGLQHSHVMDYAGGLADGIGPRLTGPLHQRASDGAGRLRGDRERERHA